MTEREWLDSLKVGDKVFVKHSGRVPISLRTVSERTKAGNIKVGEDIYNGKTARERGSSTWGWNYITPFTEEEWALEVRRRKQDGCLYLIRETRWETQSLETLQSVCNALNAAKVIDEEELKPLVLDK